jgi:hypothetical protein
MSRKIHALGGPRLATAATALWPHEFFVLRSNDSYGQKWNYVFDNPVARDCFRQRKNGNMPERLKR